ncbi:MAG: DNA polymerase III subunit chi [Nevskia sp.]
MTRIDFYILPEDAAPPAGPVLTACKLCDKATAGGAQVYVFSPDTATAGGLDSALWSFRQGSFIGHERLGGEAPEQPLPPVLIGDAEPPASYEDILINLGLDVPPFFSRFARVLEIVDSDAASRAKSRERYKFYRDRGYELATHNL